MKGCPVEGESGGGKDVELAAELAAANGDNSELAGTPAKGIAI